MLLSTTFASAENIIFLVSGFHARHLETPKAARSLFLPTSASRHLFLKRASGWIYPRSLKRHHLWDSLFCLAINEVVRRYMDSFVSSTTVPTESAKHQLFCKLQNNINISSTWKTTSHSCFLLMSIFETGMFEFLNDNFPLQFVLHSILFGLILSRRKVADFEEQSASNYVCGWQPLVRYLSAYVFHCVRRLIAKKMF